MNSLVLLAALVVPLENGLTLIMAPDASAPEVGVEVVMRGGSREEQPGQHGIAHLFEHNIPASGRFLGNPENRARRATISRNGGAGTERDFLRFYQAVAPEGLELALGFAADRLESDLEKFTEQTLTRDQDIVVSEMRRSMFLDWDPQVGGMLSRGTFGADHPYGHATYGTEAEVRAATVELMREWHRRFAGASNGVVVLVGNFDPREAEALVRKHFAPIAPGMRAPQRKEWVPAARAQREVIEKGIDKPVVYLRWPVPAWGTADADRLRVIAQVLENRGVDAEVELFEMAGSFQLRGESEAPMREALERLLRDGVTAAELARAQGDVKTAFLRSLQQTVFRQSRADALVQGFLFRGDANAYEAQLARMAAVKPGEVREAARRWLGEPGYVLQVVPQPKRVAVGTIDRGATVELGARRPMPFPAIEEATLANGTRVLAVERRALPLVQLTMVYDDEVKNVSVLSERLEEALREVKDAPRVLIASGDVDVRKLKNVTWAAPVRREVASIESKAPGVHTTIDPTATQARVRLEVPVGADVAADPLVAQLVTFALRQRLMANLRESKGWSYEVYPFGVDVRSGAATIHFNIPVKTERLNDSIAEVQKEIARMREEPMPPGELAGIRSYVASTTITSGLTSLEAMNARLVELARAGRPTTYFAHALERLPGITPEAVRDAARVLLDPAKLVWLVTKPAM